MKLYKCPFCNKQVESDSVQECQHGSARVMMKEIVLPFKPVKERATGFVDYDEVLSDD